MSTSAVETGKASKGHLAFMLLQLLSPATTTESLACEKWCWRWCWCASMHLCLATERPDHRSTVWGKTEQIFSSCVGLQILYSVRTMGRLRDYLSCNHCHSTVVKYRSPWRAILAVTHPIPTLTLQHVTQVILSKPHCLLWTNKDQKNPNKFWFHA